MSCDLLIVNATLAGTEASCPYGLIDAAAIAITGEQITFVGKQSELPTALQHSAKEVINLEGQLITPGFIDCHTHLVYAGNRAQEFEAKLKGFTYQEIAKAGGGIYSTVQATRQASEAQLLELALVRAKRYLRAGFTTIEVKSGYGLNLEHERKCLRVARQLESYLPITVFKTFLGLHALPPEFEDQPESYVETVCQNLFSVLLQEQLVDAVDAFCERIAFTPEQIQPFFELAKRNNIPIKLHAEQLSAFGGGQLAAKNQALSADHLEYVTEQEVQMMAKSGTIAVLLPAAFFYLREKQKPPIEWLRHYQVPIAIASDHNPGTAPIENPLDVLNMACLFFNLTPEEAFWGVTLNAAKALGFSDRGLLAPGKIADLSIWNAYHPLELSYALGATPLKMLIKKGSKLFKINLN